MGSSLPSGPALPASGEEARAFLQERLAFLGRVIGLIVLGFYLVSRAVIVPSTANRTLALGTAAVLAPVAVIGFVFFRAGHGPVGTLVTT